MNRISVRLKMGPVRIRTGLFSCIRKLELGRLFYSEPEGALVLAFANRGGLGH